MASSPLIEKKHLDTFVSWGVPSGPALWPIVVRILFVIDGRINTSTDPAGFGLGYVLETLRDGAFAWWVRFHVQVVRRDKPTSVPDFNYTEPQYNPAFAILGFKFTEQNFDLNDWDQVWFFGDYPAPDTDIDDPQSFPLGDGELKLLAEWMDRGGGVFAAGDHWNLGASMCSRIPRVRTMRRWTPDQGVPTQYGATRHQTLQPGTGYIDLWEGDTIPQPIELVYQRLTSSILTRPFVPHPLFGTSTGVIETFPDHMHEGEVINDNEVELDSPLNIPGYERPEYPSVEPQTNPGIIARTTSASDLRPRPRPHVVAYGQTTNTVLPETEILARLAGGGNAALLTKKFGLVGTYDGDRVGIGRVVVDSTWHHWFSYNLHGFVAADPDTQYQLMQAYYRNVGVWLATPAQRQSMLVATAWGIVVSDPMAFPLAPARSLWAVGGREPLGVMARTVSQSMLFDFVASCFGGTNDQIFAVPQDVDPSEPYVASVPADLAVRAIVGGIASSLIKPASEYLQAHGKPRRLLDPDVIAQHAAAGFKQGYIALIDTIQSSATASETTVGRLEQVFQPSPLRPIQVELIRLRVVAEQLQFPDPTDPFFAGALRAVEKAGSTRFTISLRIALTGSVVASTVIDEIDVPSFHSAGAFVDLDRVLYDGVVQSGESLVIDVVAGAAGLESVGAEKVRFSENFVGDPLSWIGSYTPSRSQPWRLWYRIEKTERR